MAQSFEDLLAAAPEAPAEGTVILTGTLMRSSEKGKFMLDMGDGRTVTLDTSAVKGHAVIGSSVGQNVVRVDVDQKAVPAVAAGSPPPVAKPLVDAGTTFVLDHSLSIPDIDHPFTLARTDFTVLFLDHPQKHPWLDIIGQPGTGVAEIAGTLAEGVTDPGQIQQAGLAPLALAAPQQVPQSTLASLGVGPASLGTVGSDVKLAVLDKHPISDKHPINDKHPAQDLKNLRDSGATNIGSRFLD